MKTKFYKHANVIFGATTMLFCYCCYLISTYAPSPLNVYLWVLVSIICVLSGIAFGTHLTKLNESVNKDPLTGLKNRNYFFSQMNIEVARYKKTQSDISLLIVDIDNFKHINDTYGHTTGDKAIIKIADILIQNIRTTDTVARIGGEEFAIILPNTNLQGAYALVERMRVAVEKIIFCCGNDSFKVTISAGVATMYGNFEISQLIDLADKALYKAKETKNSISTMEDVATGINR